MDNSGPYVGVRRSYGPAGARHEAQHANHGVERRSVNAEVTHRSVPVNGLELHVAECGEGPLVLLCHGFPELWYSWRHQLPALAAAGYHAVAPDQRGYGDTDKPEAIEAYDTVTLADDVAALIDALGEREAVVVG